MNGGGRTGRPGDAERSFQAEIRGEAATVWVTLQDTKSRSLRGYGPLLPETGAVVDDLLEAISRHVTAIFRLVETPRGDGTRNPSAAKAEREHRR